MDRKRGSWEKAIGIFDRFHIEYLKLAKSNGTVTRLEIKSPDGCDQSSKQLLVYTRNSISWRKVFTRNSRKVNIELICRT